jgi:hypothetical protein
LLKKILFLNAYLEAIICVAIGGLFYLVISFILGIINLKEIKELASHVTSK